MSEYGYNGYSPSTKNQNVVKREDKDREKNKVTMAKVKMARRHRQERSSGKK